MEGPAEVLVEAVVDDGVAARVEVGAPQEEAAQPRRVVHERRQLERGRKGSLTQGVFFIQMTSGKEFIYKISP